MMETSSRGKRQANVPRQEGIQQQEEMKGREESTFTHIKATQRSRNINAQSSSNGQGHKWLMSRTHR